MRIQNHPILEFERGKQIQFMFDGNMVTAYENETVAAALHAAGIRVLSHSIPKGRPRGFYCAIGNCSSCMMVVDGEPNIKICLEPVRDGMVVETQRNKGDIL